MKRTLGGIILLAAVAAAYLHMPLQWRRHKDIAHGNRLIERTEQYRTRHFRLPENHDTAALAELGFVKNKQGWQPAYRKLGDNRYLIIYRDGYAPPYLYWDSAGKIWTLAPDPDSGSRAASQEHTP